MDWHALFNEIKQGYYDDRPASLDCEHVRKSRCRVIVYGGQIQVRDQCADCGLLVGTAIKRDKVLDFESLPLVDAKKLEELAVAEQKARESRKEVFWQAYNRYLESDDWARKRHLILSRSGGVCEGCGEQEAKQVHHRSYDNVGGEMLFELVALCMRCHERLHSNLVPMPGLWKR